LIYSDLKLAMKITKDIYIEDMVQEIPGSVRYLADRGIMCIACGEPIWGTLEEAARKKGFSDEQISVFVREINEL
jgi:methionine synthase II (cobalamin-independent)